MDPLAHPCSPDGAESRSTRVLRAVGVTAAVLALLVGAMLSLQPRHEQLSAPVATVTPVAAAPARSAVAHAVAGWRQLPAVRPGSGEVLVPADAATGPDGRAAIMCPQGGAWHRTAAWPGHRFTCPSGAPGKVWSTG